MHAMQTEIYTFYHFLWKNKKNLVPASFTARTVQYMYCRTEWFLREKNDNVLQWDPNYECNPKEPVPVVMSYLIVLKAKH